MGRPELLDRLKTNLVGGKRRDMALMVRRRRLADNNHAAVGVGGLSRSGACPRRHSSSSEDSIENPERLAAESGPQPPGGEVSAYPSRPDLPLSHGAASRMNNRTRIS
jgi:hypothetical protein